MPDPLKYPLKNSAFPALSCSWKSLAQIQGVPSLSRTFQCHSVQSICSWGPCLSHTAQHILDQVCTLLQMLCIISTYLCSWLVLSLYYTWSASFQEVCREFLSLGHLIPLQVSFLLIVAFYFICKYMYSCMAWHGCGSQRITYGNLFFLLPHGPRGWTQVISLGKRCLYLLRHFVQTPSQVFYPGCSDTSVLGSLPEP